MPYEPKTIRAVWSRFKKSAVLRLPHLIGRDELIAMGLNALRLVEEDQLELFTSMSDSIPEDRIDYREFHYWEKAWFRWLSDISNAYLIASGLTTELAGEFFKWWGESEGSSPNDESHIDNDEVYVESNLGFFESDLWLLDGRYAEEVEDGPGKSVRLSNYKVLHDDFNGTAGFFIFEEENHDNRVMIGLGNRKEDDSGAYAPPIKVIDMILKLIDYPVLDEDKMVEIEFEDREEAWASWARAEFRSALINEWEDAIDAYNSDYGSAHYFSNVSREEIRELFDRIADDANYHWEEDSEGNQWIPVEKVAKAASVADIEQLFGDIDLSEYV